MPYEIRVLITCLQDADHTFAHRIMSRYAYDNTGAQYNATMIMDEHGNLDSDKYKAYSPLFIP